MFWLSESVHITEPTDLDKLLRPLKVRLIVSGRINETPLFMCVYKDLIVDVVLLMSFC